MKLLRLLPLLIASFVIAGAVFGEVPASATGSGPGEITPKKHNSRKASDPIVVNWAFKKGLGSTNLTVNPDGTYLFSGNYKHKVPKMDFEIVLALKSSLGGILLFHYVGNVSSGGVQWSKQGQSDFLKDDFKTFGGERDWAAYEWHGVYHFELDSEAKKQLAEQQAAAAKAARADAYHQCAGEAFIGLFGVNDAYAQSQVKYCQQFNWNW